MKKLIKIVLIILLCIQVTTTTKFAGADAEELKYGGTAVIGMVTEPRSFNVMQAEDTFLERISDSFLLPLVRFIPGEQGGFVGVLAESWEVSPDAKTYTFHLNKDAIWEDGEPVTSFDVKYTIDYIIEKELQKYSLVYNEVERVETHDSYTVSIILKESDAAFMHIMELVPLPKHIFEGTDWETNEATTTKPLSNGPYTFKEWVKGSHMTFIRNKNFWGEKAYLDSIIFTFVKDQTIALTQLETGELSAYTGDMPYAMVDSYRAKSGLDVAATETYPVHINFNMRIKPFDDIRVRKAIVMAVNRTDVSLRAYSGVSKETDYFCGEVPGVWMWMNPEIKQPAYDPEEAEKLLDDAGYPRGSDGVRFETSIISWVTKGTPDAAKVVVSNLKEVGIEVTHIDIDWGSFTDRVINNYNFEMGFMASGHGPDPSMIEKFFASDGFRNIAGFNNSRVDELFDLGKSTGSWEERAEYYGEIQEIVNRDLPRFTVVSLTSVWPYRTEYQGFPFQEEYRDSSYWWNNVWWTQGFSPSTLDDVMAAIDNAEEEGLTIGLEDVESLYNQAVEAFDDMEYLTAAELSEQAMSALEGVEHEKTFWEVYGTGISAGAIVIVIALAVFYYLRKRS